MTRPYANAAAFRDALESRLRDLAQARGVQIQGLRLKITMERLIARLFHDSSAPWLLKGGYAMELRFRPKARTTRDLDLAIVGPLGAAARAGRLLDVHDALMDAAGRDLGDYFEFTIPPARDELVNAPGGGGVFSVLGKVAGREFARFHVDVGFGDAALGTPERLVGDDLLSFAGIVPPQALAVPKPQQFAEKLHAYTFPWTDRENTRSRDLVDMVLLIERGELDRREVLAAIEATFAHRQRHSVPEELAPPPSVWSREFPVMATEAGISATDLDAAFLTLKQFWHELRPRGDRTR